MSFRKNRDVAKSVRVEDVARLAGVSPITVSRALSSPDLVKDETRRRVEEAVRQTGYIVNRFASTLRSGRSSIVSVFISSLKDTEIALSMQGLADAFEGSKYQILFSHTPRTNDASDQDVLAAALPLRPAGVAFSSKVSSKLTRQRLVEHDIPTVEMWTGGGDAVDMAVSLSERGSGQALGRHLGIQGYRRVLLCGSIPDRGDPRLAGLKIGLEEGGASLVDVFPTEDATTLAAARQVFDAILNRYEGLDAVIASHDVLAEGCLLRATERQMMVPSAFGIASLGLCGSATSRVSTVTTLRPSGYEVGLEAGRLLVQRLAGLASRKHVEVASQLEVAFSTQRQSVAV